MAVPIPNIFGEVNGFELLIASGFFIICLIASGVISFVVIQRRSWPFKVAIAEAVGDKPPLITRRTRARLIKFGDGGEELFLLQKPRKLRAAYGKRIGLREILFVIGDDGLWYNTDFENFNKKLKQIGLNPIDKEVRLANSSIRKGVDTDFGNKNFMEKYGEVIRTVLFVVMILAFIGMMWFLFDQQRKISATNLETMKLVKEVLQSIAQIKGNAPTSGLITVK